MARRPPNLPTYPAACPAAREMRAAPILRRFKEKQRRRKDEVAGRHLERRHRDMLQRVGATATLPKPSQHIQQMRGGPPVTPEHRPPRPDAPVRRLCCPQAHRTGSLNADDAALLELFNTIREFADLPDCTPAKKMPSGLNGFQRAMVHQ